MSILFHPRKSQAVAVLVLGPLSMLCAGFGLSSAGAATASNLPAVATGHTSQFCAFALNASKTNTSAAATSTPKSLTAVYAKLKSEEPVILAASPSQIKGDFQTLFNYLNKFYVQLASVHYNYLKLSPTYIEGLAKSALPVEAASKAIEAYLVKTCGIATVK